MGFNRAMSLIRRTPTAKFQLSLPQVCLLLLSRHVLLTALCAGESKAEGGKPKDGKPPRAKDKQKRADGGEFFVLPLCAALTLSSLAGHREILRGSIHSSEGRYAG
jgi:hypothetical protein